MADWNTPTNDGWGNANPGNVDWGGTNSGQDTWGTGANNVDWGNNESFDNAAVNGDGDGDACNGYGQTR